MDTKAKKCKGNYKVKYFKGCEHEKMLYKFGLCKSCFMDWCFDTEDGKVYYSNQFKPKAKIKLNTEIKKDKKGRIDSMREKSKSIAKLIAETRIPFQKLIRIRDFGKGCVCCGESLGDSRSAYDAGHYLKAELYSGLIFHPDNVHGQRKFCNQHLSGNEAEYGINLPNRIGQERFDWLINNRFRLKGYKYHRNILNDMKAFYTKELKEVNNGKCIEDVDFMTIIEPIIKNFL